MTDDGKYIIVFPDKGGEYMVYFASLEEQTRKGGIKEKLSIIPIVDNLENSYYVSNFAAGPDCVAVGVDFVAVLTRFGSTFSY